MDIYRFIFETSTQMCDSSISYLIIGEIEYSECLCEMIRSMENNN